VPPLPTRPAKRNETRDMVRPMVAALNAIPGVWASRNLTGSGFARSGLPVTFGLGNGSADIVCAIAPHGRMVGLEVKWPGRRPKPNQLAWRDRMRRIGVAVETVHSVNEATSFISRLLASP
jgi:hypothetical protein